MTVFSFICDVGGILRENEDLGINTAVGHARPRQLSLGVRLHVVLQTVFDVVAMFSGIHFFILPNDFDEPRQLSLTESTHVHGAC